jgi:hypothetical protein
VGVALVVLMFAVFPLRMAIQVEHAPMGETETMSIGWLFAPVIGAWGLARLAISACGNLDAGKRVFIRLLPAFFLLYFGCGYGLWMASLFGFSNLYWWMQFVLILAPTVMATVMVALSYIAKEKVGFLTNKTASNALVTVTAAVPVLFAACSWCFWLTL